MFCFKKLGMMFIMLKIPGILGKTRKLNLFTSELLQNNQSTVSTL